MAERDTESRVAVMETVAAELKNKCISMEGKIDRLLDRMPDLHVHNERLNHLEQRIEANERNLKHTTEAIYNRLWAGLVGILTTLAAVVGKFIFDAVGRGG